MKWTGGLELLRNGPLSILLFGITSFCLCLLPIGGLTASNASDYLAGVSFCVFMIIKGTIGLDGGRYKGSCAWR